MNTVEKTAYLLFVLFVTCMALFQQIEFIKKRRKEKEDWWYDSKIFESFWTPKFRLMMLVGYPPKCPKCLLRMIPCAFLLDEGWTMHWDCQTEEHRGRVFEWMDHKDLEISWPYAVNAVKHVDELEVAGFVTFIL